MHISKTFIEIGSSSKAGSSLANRRPLRSESHWASSSGEGLVTEVAIVAALLALIPIIGGAFAHAIVG